VTAYVEITTNSLAGLNQGGQDANLNGMAEGVAAWLKAGANRHILIAPLPEMNLSHHAWGGNPSGFKTGYAHIRGAFLDQGLTPSQIRFVFAPNGTSDVGEFNDYYPGGATVDVIGFARLNRGDPWLDYNAVFRTHIDDLQARVSLAKPILVTQTGSLTHASRAGWLGDMFTNLKANPQVIGAIYFNRNKDHDYRVLVNGVMDSAFRSGYQNWSNPNEVDWIFDGRMDAWVQARAAAFSSGFIDIQGHIFQNAITWLSDQGITEGCNPPNNTRFCPQDLVTRGQMAVFIARALGLPSPMTPVGSTKVRRTSYSRPESRWGAPRTGIAARNRYPEPRWQRSWHGSSICPPPPPIISSTTPGRSRLRSTSWRKPA
jgi:hypothetical protein